MLATDKPAPALSNTDFGRTSVRQMFADMVEWLGEQQVRSEDGVRAGAIYFPTENRHCNRDTACAAAVFMRQHRITGEANWPEKARQARDYVLRVQAENGGYPELRGPDDSDEGSMVNTAIIADNLIHAYELGLEWDERDCAALTRMAAFMLTLEWKPGAFYHDTNHLKTHHNHVTGDKEWGEAGSKKDCQNTTALAAMALQRVYHFLDQAGEQTEAAWLDAAARAVNHLLEGQNRAGQWPYLFGADWKDMGHHGMAMYYLERAAQYAPHNQDPRILDALKRGGTWLVDEGLLQTKRGTKINWAINSSACTYFTADYFLVAAPLVRLGQLDTEKASQWQHEGLELLRYVRTDLWDNPASDKEGPFRLTEAGLSFGFAWFGQSMGWALYQLDDVIEQMGWWDE